MDSLIEALKLQLQIDHDGVMCGVSRQVVDAANTKRRRSTTAANAPSVITIYL